MKQDFYESSYLISPKYKMFRGYFPASLFYMISASIAITSLVVIYYQSQIYHQ